MTANPLPRTLEVGRGGAMAGTIHELTVDECLELLGTGDVGRVALNAPTGIHIVPVNYAMYGDAIVFRTAPYSELGTHGMNTEIAFEIDELDRGARQGWSVVATGKVVLVDDPDEVADIRRGLDPSPWAAGQRNLYLKLEWRNLTGRRIVA